MQIIAHRGASGEFPENTLLAIEQAIVQGADAVEIDVFAVQGELIVIHDHHLHRTTNGSGSIYQYSLAELMQLDAGQGQRIPTLWQVLELTHGKCWLNIELKGDNTVAPLLTLLEKAKQQLGFDCQQLLISSFNHHLLVTIKRERPDLKLGALTASLPVDYAAFASQLQAYSINCDVSFINQAMVDDAKARGLKVYVYTVDQPDEIRRLKNYGVDGIFSNYPAKSRVAANKKPAV
ncbi:MULTISPECIES: glycerophosphodiester phosphodiesterase [unclassified Arsukibacterium]|uniref:glycerophosphodiester phosphodiesterase n=1 Tax=unclassified Arsukibacterium TaxID=2635278 RepID=UPI000C40521F|nr:MULTISPECIES: glycerophosphodiester phosphodiesterase family protein [unclassified Arsukibacterium]MAA93953.1 glycerophosphodiester phosphodiesterase [Rheinheimera sp.]MBM33644.1 glycerophosphodiester phosphodiesterase [Rheinheimera sp.]HAW94492.1 glycerophosphodiester phosphodiesterase [Candidatus Azambacteria bacterium]|tara:strand:- start:609 stop:1313 length:705 start_codon:yes stop_codon:yes gene_type:complete